MEKIRTSLVIGIASLFCLYAYTSFSQTKKNVIMKSFVTAAPDTVEQGVPFIVNYTLTAVGWDAGDAPLEGNGCRLQKVSYNSVKGMPYSLLQTKATYITSRTGNITLPSMKMSVQKKDFFATPKTIYVKPNRKYGEEMDVAHKWLVAHGMNEDSLCLTAFENSNIKELYVFRDGRGKGFCIVAKKENWNVVNQPVMAYSTENSLLLQEWRGFAQLLNSYSNQIVALKKHPNTNANGGGKQYGRKNSQVTPMLGNLRWGQSSPYNRHVIFSIEGKRGVIGCVPLAVAMIMNYHKWPKQTQSHVYYQTDQKVYKMDLDNYTPEWDTYRDTYSEKDTIESENLALLLSRLGIALDATYKGKATSANMLNVKSMMCNNFKYSGKMNINLMPLPDDEMISIIYKELDEGRPFLAGIDNHTFVCDGYDGDFLHYNLGWHGAANEDNVTHLVVSGPLNSADIKLLRKMAGAIDDDASNDSWTGGALRILDLSDATIVGDKEPYLTEKASGTWHYWETSMFGSSSSVYSFDKMDEKMWRKFKSEIGTKQEGMFYTRTDDNKYWVNYYCTKNEIGKNMFERCTSLYKIILPEKTTKIDSYAFLHCWSLMNMHIPEKVKEVGEKPFCLCLSLDLHLAAYLLRTGHPYPEGGAFTFTIAFDSDAATAAFGNRLADVESEAGALNEFIELDEALEDGGLLFLGDSCACVFAVDVESGGGCCAFGVGGGLVSHPDMSLLCVLDSVDDEVGDDLLNASFVESCVEGGVGVFLDELDAGCLHTLLECLADVVEGLCKVDGCGLYVEG